MFATLANMPTAEDYFAHRLRAERERRGWSQTELAQRMAEHGVSLHFSAIHKMEQRDAARPRVIRLNEAEAACAALGIPVWQMLAPMTADEMTHRLAEVQAELSEASALAGDAQERVARLSREALLLTAAVTAASGAGGRGDPR